MIDDDLGKSGGSADDRHGFKRLTAEVATTPGCALSLDASRLARNNRDWHQLLELCSLFDVLNRRRRAAPRSRRSPRSPAAGAVGPDERGRAAPAPGPAPPGRAPEGGARRAPPAAPAGLAYGPAGTITCSTRTRRCGRGSACLAPRARQRQGGDALPAARRSRVAGQAGGGAGAARGGLATGRQPPGARHPQEPGLRGRLRLRPAATEPFGPATRLPDACDGGGGHLRRPGDLPARRPPATSDGTSS